MENINLHKKDVKIDFDMLKSSLTWYKQLCCEATHKSAHKEIKEDFDNLILLLKELLTNNEVNRPNIAILSNTDGSLLEDCGETTDSVELDTITL